MTLTSKRISVVPAVEEFVSNGFQIVVQAKYENLHFAHVKIKL